MSSEIKLTDEIEEIRRHRPVALVALGTVLVLVTYVTPVASTPQAAAALGTGSGGVAWMLSSMSLGLAAGLLPAGSLGDALGRRRAYLVGLALMGVGAIACALVTENAGGTGLFVAGRVVEGLGGAAVLACGLAVLSHAAADAAERARSTAVWGASVGLGIAIGAVLAAALGGVGTGWRETYAVVAVLAVALVVPSARMLPESRSERPRRLDPAGLVLLVVAMTLLVAGLTEARSGFGGVVIGLLAGAVMLLAGFAVVERRVAEPMVDPGLVRSPGFVAASIGSLALGAGMIAMTSNTPILVTLVLGGTLWEGTALVLVWAVTSVATSLVVRSHPVPLPGPRVIALALLVVAVGQLLGLGVGADSSPWRLVPSMFVAGLATGVLNAVLGREAVASVPADRAAMGSGSNNTARYLGAACGITAFSVLLTHVGWDTAVLVSAAASLGGAAATGFLRTNSQA